VVLEFKRKNFGPLCGTKPALRIASHGKGTLMNLSTESESNTLEMPEGRFVKIIRDNPKILIIDNWRAEEQSLRSFFDADRDVTCTNTMDQGLKLLRQATFDVVFIDIRRANFFATELVRKINDYDPGVSIILVIGENSLSTAQEVLQFGGHDFVKFPFEETEIREVVWNASHRTQVIRFLKAVTTNAVNQ
jgi:DNA-binding NtrC family response regulator